VSSEKPDTRSRILEATWKLMERKPGGGVRMSDIAKAAGISRQALYLHFDARADLLSATTRYMDDVMDVQKRLQPSRNATTGTERIKAFIAFWGSYLPQIRGVAGALLSMREADDAAAAAWSQRMTAVREGCEAAVQALHRDGNLLPDWTINSATDLLCTMLSIQTWEMLTGECCWSQEEYISRMQHQALATFTGRRWT
jgi:AcrR family transcriptional regulator